jgi:uncharacterized protein
MGKRLIDVCWLCIGVTLISFGIALMNKSGLGQTAYSGLANVVGQITSIRNGTVLIYFNIAFILGQIIVLKKDFKAIQFLQVVVSYLNGVMVNFWIYDFALTSGLIPANYAMQWVFSILGNLLISFGVGIVMISAVIKMPVEAFVQVLSEKSRLSFARLRTMVDVMCIVIGIGLILSYRLSFSSLREGTWVSMVLLGSSMGFTFPLAKKMIDLLNSKLLKKEQV